MIVATVSFRIAPGKNLEAVEYLGKLTRHIKSLTGHEQRILTRLGGPVGHVILSGQYEDLNAWDHMRSKLTSDPTFQKMTTEAGNAGLFIPGSVESALWQES